MRNENAEDVFARRIRSIHAQIEAEGVQPSDKRQDQGQDTGGNSKHAIITGDDFDEPKIVYQDPSIIPVLCI